MEIQELISRGRLLFHGAPKRLDVFKLVNGRRSAKDIAKRTGRSLSSALQDLQKMKDMDLIKPKINRKNLVVKKQGSTVFEKIPQLRHVSMTYFEDPIKAKKKFGKQFPKVKKKAKDRQLRAVSTPNEKEILEICRTGEDQPYEFKSAGVNTEKLAREVAAFANTKIGGIIFYGIDDDGTISGSDKHRQELDQSLQNAVRNTISPSLTIAIKEKDLLGHRIALIIVPPWNKKDVYHYKGKVLIRKGTNVFTAKPEESRKLHKGIYVV
ncbi:MAG: RNA-binding domain-containing protein [Planctomycetota bacterium]